MFMNRPKTFATLLMALALVTCAASTAGAADWNLARDFSTTANPNGAWSNGLYQADGSANAFDFWPLPDYYWRHSGLAHLAFYGNPSDYSFIAGAVCYNPDSADCYYGANYHLWLRPGEVALWAAQWGNIYAPVIRWTAPAAMTVSIDALFTGRCDVVSSDVHVLLSGDETNGPSGGDPIFTGTHLFDGAIDGNYGCAEMGIAATGTTQSQSYSGIVTLAAGDHIDFVVGYGPDHWNGQDMVGLSATITEIPEPASLSLLGCALAGLLACAWRKRK
jgi:hypothetical protein